MGPVFTQGVYEGPTRFDDVYTRVVDAMVEVDRISYIADPRSTLQRCQRQANTVFALLQSRAFEAIERMDFQQAVTDEGGGREVAWIYNRGDLECDILGLPAGPHVTEDDLDPDGSDKYEEWKQWKTS